MSMSRRWSVSEVGTIIVLLVVLSVAFALLPGRRQPDVRRLKNNARMRSIHQAMVGYGAGNRDFSPGLDSRGQVVPDGEDTNFSGDGLTLEGRFAIMFKSKLLSPESVISPLKTERGRRPWDPGDDGATPVTDENYSYALLAIDSSTRRAEWDSERLNNRALLVCDRNTGAGTGTDPSKPDHAASLHDRKLWQGSTVWNDGHTEYLDSQIVPQTQYGDAAPNTDDSIFEAAGPNDAWMIHETPR